MLLVFVLAACTAFVWCAARLVSVVCCCRRCGVLRLSAPPFESPLRVAVVGSGIAGMAAAWSLARATSAFRLTVFEQRSNLGGNAKSHIWRDTRLRECAASSGFARSVRTGLSVLAWPPAYFHNYRALLDLLGVATERVRLPFAVQLVDRSNPSNNGEWLHDDPDSSLPRRFAADLTRWKRMVRVIRAVNNRLHGTSPESPSLYAMSLLNPFNLLPLGVTAKLAGISDDFWRIIVVPLYSTSFLSTDLHRVPTVVLPTLDDIVPIDRVATMDTWKDDSSVVFEAMARQPGLTVRLECGVKRIVQSAPGAPQFEWTVEDSHGEFHRFDHVVFACDAVTVVDLLCSSSPTSFPLHRALLSAVEYVDEAAFQQGQVHTDASQVWPSGEESVWPKADEADGKSGEPRSGWLSYANYTRVEPPPASSSPAPPPSRLSRSWRYLCPFTWWRLIRPVKAASGWSYRNTFILSAWLPLVARMRALGTRPPPLLVSYNHPGTIPSAEAVVDNRRAHPAAGGRNVVLSQAVRMLQGQHRLWFCGAYTTPGNGHDLSLLSGLAVAHALGADYPFEHIPSAAADFRRLRGLMGL